MEWFSRALALLYLKKNVGLLVVYLKEGSFMSFTVQLQRWYFIAGLASKYSRAKFILGATVLDEKMSLTSNRKKVKIFVHGLDAYSCVIKNLKQKQVK